jgi:beta-galactosidase
VPAGWRGRRILLRVEYLNSQANIYIDGRPAGELWFPGGEIDLTALCTPGARHSLALHVTARPLRDVITAYSDSNMARQVEAAVERRGLCGDVFLLGAPAGAQIGSVRIGTSVRREEIVFHTGLEGLLPDGRYTLRARIGNRQGTAKVLESAPIRSEDLQEGCYAFSARWLPDALWDLHTPGNQYDAELSLHDSRGRLLDAALPIRFGFREFYAEGSDFYFNGSRIWLSCVPFDNAQYGAGYANYESARESLRRLKASGINFVYTHNYGCEPGSHLGFGEVLRAADDIGMLVAFSQPHFAHYEWEQPGADAGNGYAHHAAFYAAAAGNHPSVVFYSTSHNATGYSQDMNPFLIDGVSRDDSDWSRRNVGRALRAEAIIRRLDPDRIVYHHHSGNLGSMYTCNFYGNWIPQQEMGEWFGHWAAAGEKPALLVEFSTPFTWDYGMYRGWYKGVREFGSAPVPWEFCLAEWNAQFIGDEAYDIPEYEKANLRWEAERFRKGEVWTRWQYPYSFDHPDLDERNRIFAAHFAANWRAFRTWGVSAVNAMWHYTIYWRLQESAAQEHVQFETDWQRLQRPGFSPDLIGAQRERFDMGYRQDDWKPTDAATAITENHGDLTAYIGGRPDAFTEKGHIFCPGDTVEKQLIVINNSRERITCICSWRIGLPQAYEDLQTLQLETGTQQRIPLRFGIPPTARPGAYGIHADFRFSGGALRSDDFVLHVLPAPEPPALSLRIALYDPQGETARELDAMGLSYDTLDARDSAAQYDMFIIGKNALSVDGPGPDLRPVREGMVAIVFEQQAAPLERRLGFRVQEYGLRQVFRRIPGHPLLAGLDEPHLRDWNGEATLLPPRSEGAPDTEWCGIPVTHAWRCGNRGNVASVLIEKPPRGNFLPLVDGGFSLQYSPLMEYREGSGRVLFCQMDVTGRSESDPAARRLLYNLIAYAGNREPVATPNVHYVGEPAGRAHLLKAGVPLKPLRRNLPTPGSVLVIGPGGGYQMAPYRDDLVVWSRKGGCLLAIGLDEPELAPLLPFSIHLERMEHIAAQFNPPAPGSPFAGIGPADVHNRAPKVIPLVTGGAARLGNGVLAHAVGCKAVFCQMVPWHCDYSGEQHNIKQTFRRSSFLLGRLLGNLGAAGGTPLPDRFGNPAAPEEKRWLEGLYLDEPEEWDDPYRFFRW